MKLTMPEGFMPPKDSRPGEPFEVVATISPSEDGGFSLTAIDGVKMPEDDEEDDEGEEEEGMMPANERTDATNVRLPFGEDEMD